MAKEIFKDEVFSIVYHNINALELWEVEQTRSHPAKNMNLKLTKKGPPITGFGIYSISYEDERHGDRIIYLGKFAGVKNKSKKIYIDDASAGDVRDRWHKHIGTATLLLTHLKMGSSKLFYEHQKRSRVFYKDDENFKAIADNAFIGLKGNALKDHVFLTRKDLQVSNNRLGFAIQNLMWTNNSHPSNTDELRAVISRFNCHYWQVIPARPTKKSIINSVLEGSKAQIGAESEVIKIYKHKLPMNSQYVRPNVLKDFYHYDPESLIKVSNEPNTEFSKYSDLITLKMQKLINPVLINLERKLTK